MNNIPITSSLATSPNTSIQLSRPADGGAPPELSQPKQDEHSSRNSALALKMTRGKILKSLDQPFEGNKTKMDSSDFEKLEREFKEYLANGGPLGSAFSFKADIWDYVKPSGKGSQDEKIAVDGERYQSYITILQKELLDNFGKGELTPEEYVKKATESFLVLGFWYAKMAGNVEQQDMLTKKLAQVKNAKDGSADNVFREYVHKYILDCIRAYMTNLRQKEEKLGKTGDYYDKESVKFSNLSWNLEGKYPSID